MKANELRIGNYISYNSATGGWWQERQVHPSDFDKTCAGTLLCENFMPVKLTQEWLIRFGFLEIVSGQWIHYDNQCYLRKIIGGYEFDTPNYKPVIKYVHQLQNLVFALSGEELT